MFSFFKEKEKVPYRYLVTINGPNIGVESKVFLKYLDAKNYLSIFEEEVAENSRIYLIFNEDRSPVIQHYIHEENRDD